MSGRFFITGLPRSRTAWFSVATTTPSSACFHEPTSGLKSYADLKKFWAPKFGVDIGVSDSCLALMAPRILADLSPRTLIIERPLEDVMRSYIAYASKTGISVLEAAARKFAEAWVRSLESVRDHPLVKVVQFSDLDDYSAVLAAMRWLLPHRDFPDLKALMTFNIQVSAKHIRELAAKPHNGWHLEGMT